MTTEDLRTLLREDALANEPAFTMSSRAAITAGRRQRRVRLAGAGLATAAVVAAAAVVAPGLLDGSSNAPEVDAATAAALKAFDPAEMPETLTAAVTEAVEGAPPFTGSTVVAEDGNGTAIPPKDRDKASMWVGTYGWSPTQHLRVALLHSKSESEGDPDEYCKDGLESGYHLTCTAERLEDGTVVITSSSAMRPARDLPKGQWYGVSDVESVNPDRLWFRRSVEARRGGIYVVHASEVVKASSLEDAEEAWHVDPDQLQEIAVQPELVFPEPPIDPATGCTWEVPRDNVTSSCS